MAQGQNFKAVPADIPVSTRHPRCPLPLRLYSTKPAGGRGRLQARDGIILIREDKLPRLWRVCISNARKNPTSSLEEWQVRGASSARRIRGPANARTRLWGDAVRRIRYLSVPSAAPTAIR